MSASKSAADQVDVTKQASSLPERGWEEPIQGKAAPEREPRPGELEEMVAGANRLGHSFADVHVGAPTLQELSDSAGPLAKSKEPEGKTALQGKFETARFSAATGDRAGHDLGRVDFRPIQRQPTLKETLHELWEPQPSPVCDEPVQLHVRDTIKGTKDYGTALGAIQKAPVNERQEALTNQPTVDYINKTFLGKEKVILMSALLEGSQEWKNPTANDFFEYFYTNKGKGTLPNTATMNCWESIIYAAYLAKKVDAAWIYKFYKDTLASADANLFLWTTLGFSTALDQYPAKKPKAGQLLFYHSGGATPGHVALSLGGDDAMSLWHSPNNIEAVQKIKVADLPGTVYFTNPPW
ncbi:MAG: C40 family peptidase [bacterium]|nr:C40 family peptidase [bacterium]